MARARKTGTAGKAAPPGNNDQWLDDYRMMLLIRRFEERAGQLYGMGLIGGFCHLYIGQEAIAVGMESVKREGDEVITGYRDHGLMLADVQVAEAADQTHAVELAGALFEAPDEQHHTIVVEPLIVVTRRRGFPRRCPGLARTRHRGLHPNRHSH